MFLIFHLIFLRWINCLSPNICFSNGSPIFFTCIFLNCGKIFFCFKVTISDSPVKYIFVVYSGRRPVFSSWSSTSHECGLSAIIALSAGHSVSEHALIVVVIAISSFTSFSILTSVMYFLLLIMD